MIHRMENNKGASKKKIKVRKPPISPTAVTMDVADTNLNYEEDYYIPIASNDSQWNGIQFTLPKDENLEHVNCLTDIENEIKVIELESEERPPLFLLFPDLKTEELNFQTILNHEVSTTDVTRMLVGKKPNLSLLKPSKKLNNKKWCLPSVVELSESEQSVTVRRPSYKNFEQKRSSRDGNESDISDNNEEI